MSNPKQLNVKTGVQTPKISLEAVAFYAAFCRHDLDVIGMVRVSAFVDAALSHCDIASENHLRSILRYSQSLVQLAPPAVVLTDVELKAASDLTVTSFD